MKAKHLTPFILTLSVLPIEDTTRDSICMNDTETMGKKIISTMVVDDSVVDSYCGGSR